jgi:hypothetical protein
MSGRPPAVREAGIEPASPGSRNPWPASGPLPETVPAAGVEPAAPSVSARCSYQLGYTGIGQRRRQESNLLRVGLRPTAWPSGPGVVIGHSQRWDSNPLRPRYEGGARPVEHRWRRGWPVGVEPTHRRFTAGSRTHFGFAHSIPVRNRTSSATFGRSHASTTPQGHLVSTPARSRTWTCSFARSHDLRFTTEVWEFRGWSRTNTGGFRARRPAVRRPRNEAARGGFDPLCPA